MPQFARPGVYRILGCLEISAVLRPVQLDRFDLPSGPQQTVEIRRQPRRAAPSCPAERLVSPFSPTAQQSQQYHNRSASHPVPEHGGPPSGQEIESSLPDYGVAAGPITSNMIGQHTYPGVAMTAKAPASTTADAQELVSLCRAGRNLDAITKLYSPKIVSIESVGSKEMPAEMTGIDAIRQKNEWWFENNEVHKA
jgi:hypothetical protein